MTRRPCACIGWPPSGETLSPRGTWDSCTRPGVAAWQRRTWRPGGFFGPPPRGGVAAVRFYRLAAEQGDSGGQASLAVMYESGRGGLAKDEVEAVRLYRLAVDQGNAYAQTRLGLMHEHGRGGLEKNDV